MGCLITNFQGEGHSDPLPGKICSKKNTLVGQGLSLITRSVHYFFSYVSSFIADIAGKVVERSTFLSKLMEDEGDSDARTMWKYSCSSKCTGVMKLIIAVPCIPACPLPPYNLIEYHGINSMALIRVYGIYIFSNF